MLRYSKWQLPPSKTKAVRCLAVQQAPYVHNYQDIYTYRKNRRLQAAAGLWRGGLSRGTPGCDIEGRAYRFGVQSSDWDGKPAIRAIYNLIPSTRGASNLLEIIVGAGEEKYGKSKAWNRRSWKRDARMGEEQGEIAPEEESRGIDHRASAGKHWLGIQVVSWEREKLVADRCIHTSRILSNFNAYNQPIAEVIINYDLYSFIGSFIHLRIFHSLVCNS